MRTILTAYKAYILPYYQSFVIKGYLLSVAFMLAIIIYCNYFIGFPQFFNPLHQFLFDYGLYALPFWAAYMLQYFFYGNNKAFYNQQFRILLLLAPAFFAVRVNLKLFTYTGSFFIANEQYIISSLNYLVRAVALVIMASTVWFFYNRKEMPLYGIKKTKDNSIYIVMLMLMIPLLLLAVNRPSFQVVYPKSFFEAGLIPYSNYLKYLLFELCYGFDFFSIEFFFRGFLIFAFAKYFGMHAIIPAACFYCCIHLGKPMPEAISSFFGGLLLGIMSYNTKSIWGGLFVHLGIAWMMELLALFI